MNEGTRERVNEGTRERGNEGTRGRGDEGTRERGDEEETLMKMSTINFIFTLFAACY